MIIQTAWKELASDSGYPGRPWCRCRNRPSGPGRRPFWTWGPSVSAEASQARPSSSVCSVFGSECPAGHGFFLVRSNGEKRTERRSQWSSLWTGRCSLTFEMSLMMSWYLSSALTRLACSRLRRFLWIFLFFCSRGSWLSSRTAGLLFNPSGVWASWTARRSATFTCSDSCNARSNHLRNTNFIQLVIKNGYGVNRYYRKGRISPVGQ